jgi:cell wall-associated NlpC family hydrolase
MSLTVRLTVALLAVLLAACSSTPPPAPRKVVYRPVVSAPPQFPSPLADDVLLRAIGLVGTPYRWGGNTPDSGFDCSGLIGYVYHDAAGITLPRSTREMITLRGPDIDRSQLQTGDLVFFATGGGSNVSHAGIYVGEGRFVHAPATGGTVKLSPIGRRPG